MPATPTTRQHAGFAGVDQPDRWEPTRSTPRPALLGLPVETLPGVGPAVRRKLGKLGIATVGDVLAHRPRRYESAAEERAIADLFGDEEAVLEVVVRRASARRRGRLHILTAHVTDSTGEIRATWFNQPWLEAKLTPGTRLRLRGKQNRFGFQVSSYDIGEAAETADFAPVYPSTADLAQKTLRSPSHATAASRSRPASVPPSGFRSAATRSSGSIDHARRRRPRPLAGASHSTSCSRFSSPCGAVPRSGKRSSQRPCRRPRSSSRATATCCRSR